MGIQTFEEREVYAGFKYEGLLQTSVLDFATTIAPNHISFGSLSGSSYSGNDLPNDSYKTGTFYVNSRTNTSKVVFIVPDDTTYTPVYNVYTSSGWSGWKSLGSGGGGSIVVDSQLSTTSTNPVQNKVITSALNNKANISDIPTELSELTNDVGYITSISNTDVTNALGYVPYNSSNPNGYITGINSSDVTTALGYTPYSSANPAGYITNSALSGYATETYVNSYHDSTKQDVLTAGNNIEIEDNVISAIGGIDYLTGTGTAAKTTTPYCFAKWDFTDENITEYYDGLAYFIKIPVAGNSTYGSCIQINNLGYHPVIRDVNSGISTRYAVNSNIMVVYVSGASGSVYGTTSGGTATSAATINGAWVVVNDHDADTTTARGYNDYYFRAYAAEAIYRYKLLLQDADNRLHPIVVTNQESSTQVAKVPTSAGLRPWKVWYYSGTTTINAGAAIGAQTIYPAMYAQTAVYNFNESTGTYMMIYLCGDYNKDTDMFTLYNDGSSPCTSYYTFVPAKTANITLSSYFTTGKYYLLVGGTYSTTNYFSVFSYNPFYYFDGTNLIPVSTKIAKEATVAAGTTATAVTSGSSSGGSATSFSRSDHVHNITSSTITGALGYTPYNSTNPNGYTSNTGTVTSVQVGATSPVQSSSSAAQTSTLSTTISLADEYGDIKNPYGVKPAGTVLASGATVKRSYDDVTLNSSAAFVNRTLESTLPLPAGSYVFSANFSANTAVPQEGYVWVIYDSTQHNGNSVTGTSSVKMNGTSSYAFTLTTGKNVNLGYYVTSNVQFQNVPVTISNIKLVTGTPYFRELTIDDLPNIVNATDGGLTVGSSNGDITIGHSNILNSAVTQPAVYPITFDKNGHITSIGTGITYLTGIGRDLDSPNYSISSNTYSTTNLYDEAFSFGILNTNGTYSIMTNTKPRVTDLFSFGTAKPATDVQGVGSIQIYVHDENFPDTNFLSEIAYINSVGYELVDTENYIFNITLKGISGVFNGVLHEYTVSLNAQILGQDFTVNSITKQDIAMNSTSVGYANGILTISTS